MWRRLSILVAGLGLLALPSGAAGYSDFRCQGFDACARTSADGSHVVFDTSDRLLPADDFNSNDVYELINGKTLRLLTPDLPDDGIKKPYSVLKGISRDGERVVIETQHAYSPQDTDIFQDTYVLEDGSWTLVTYSSGFEWFPFVGVSPDARHVYFDPFRTPLVSSDLDNDRDIYEWSREHGVRMVSTGPTENTDPMSATFGYEVEFGGVTDDGSRVAFTSDDHLTADSTNTPNTGAGVYFRDNGSTTTFIPVPGTLPDNWSGRTKVGGISPDGQQLYLNTNFQVTPDDTDITEDVYVRHSDGSFTRMSTGPAGGNGQGGGCIGEVWYACDAAFVGASRDGTRIFFMTGERMVSEDTDSSPDIYERRGSTTTLLTPGTPDQPKPMTFIWAPRFEGVSSDGTQVAFSTKSPLVPADRDERMDIYVRADGQFHLISTGPAGENSKYEPKFADFVDGGDNVIFFTKAPLLESDTDNDVDVYQRIQFNTKPKGAAAAGKRKKKGWNPGRTKLVSGERIPPRVTLSRRGSVAHGIARVRVGCPKKETSGLCKGSVRVLGGGGGAFRIKSGRKTWVTIGSARSVGGSATVVVRAKDLLGNKAKVRKRVRF